MKTSPKGIALIRSYESCKLRAYADIKGVPTIGWGTTGPDIHLGMTITQAQADSFFARDLAKFEAMVTRKVRVPLNQGQFDALVSLSYNCGSAPLDGTLGRVLNAGRYNAVPAQFMRWVNSGDQHNVKGLIRRRNAETALWRSLDVVEPDEPDTEIDPGAPVRATAARPLTESGTIRGVVLASTGTAGLAAQALDTVQTNLTTVSGIVTTLSSLQGSLVIIAVVAVVVGLGWIAYRRYADRGLIL